MNALIIGCGNIGALYDVSGKDINTHIKAYKAIPDSQIDIYDTNKENLLKTQEHFECKVVDQIDYQKYRCISICTPTASHVRFLLEALKENVPVIICEKPMSNDPEELEQIREACRLSDSQLHVNYIRRYQPQYIRLKTYIDQQRSIDNPVTNINILYQRGLMNNASHAFDLLLFFLEKLDLSQIQHSGIYPEFENDPSISFSCTINDNIQCKVTGLERINYSFFSVQIFLSNSCILIEENGNAISIFEMADEDPATSGTNRSYKANLEKLESKKDALKDYMLHVIQAVLDPDFIGEDVEKTINMTQALIKINNSYGKAGN